MKNLKKFLKIIILNNKFNMKVMKKLKKKQKYKKINK